MPGSAPLPSKAEGSHCTAITPHQLHHDYRPDLIGNVSLRGEHLCECVVSERSAEVDSSPDVRWDLLLRPRRDSAACWHEESMAWHDRAGPLAHAELEPHTLLEDLGSVQACHQLLACSGGVS